MDELVTERGLFKINLDAAFKAPDI